MASDMLANEASRGRGKGKREEYDENHQAMAGWEWPTYPRNSDIGKARWLQQLMLNAVCAWYAVKKKKKSDAD